MSTPNDLRDLYELYALGILEEPERSRIEELLNSGSPEAKARLREAMEYNAMLLAATKQVEPPKRLRRRVLGSVGFVERSRGWIGILATAAAALLIAVIYIGNQYRQSQSDLQTALSASARTNIELVRLRHVMSFLNSTDTRVVTFGQKDPKPPAGRVLLNPTRGVLLIASNLPPAPAGRIYEMWIIPKGAKPIPAGLFQSDDSGNAIHLQERTVSLDAAVAVTIEPASGSDQPTSTPLFVAAL